MFDKTVVKDNFGQHYTIQKHVNPMIRGKLNQKEFPDQHLARDFVRRLEVPNGYWHGLLNEAGDMHSPMMSEMDLECAVCERISNGQLKVFPVNPPKSGSSLKNRTIQTKQEIYQFATPDVLLLNKREVMHFNSTKDAQALLLSLSPSEEQLRAIAADLKIFIAANSGSAEISTAIAESLVKGDAVVTRDLISSATPALPVMEVANSVGNRKADLGPHESEPNEVIRKDINIQLEDEFEQALSSYASLLDELEFTLKTDMGEEHKGKISNGKISISQALINSSFELTIKDLPGYQEA